MMINAGTLSIPRAQFEALIEANGGTNVKSVNNSCTHLIRYTILLEMSGCWILADAALSSETGTKKCLDAEAKGVAIVSEDWVRSRIDGGNPSAPAPPAKRPSSTVVEPSLKQSSGTAGGVFWGLNFNVAGMFVLFWTS
jgi:hypothetical protein